MTVSLAVQARISGTAVRVRHATVVGVATACVAALTGELLHLYTALVGTGAILRTAARPSLNRWETWGWGVLVVWRWEKDIALGKRYWFGKSVV